MQDPIPSNHQPNLENLDFEFIRFQTFHAHGHEHNILIGQLKKTGDMVAISNRSPNFCMTAGCLADVVSVAQRALAFYYDPVTQAAFDEYHKTKKMVPQCTSSSPDSAIGD